MAERVAVVGWNEVTGAAVELEIDAARIAQQDASKVAQTMDGGVIRDVFRATVPRKDPAVLEIGKWAAVVLSPDVGPAREALLPLFEARASVAWRGDAEPGLLIMDRPDTDTNTDRWIKRLRQVAAAAGVAPPHYLLLVGGPDRVPIEVQRALDQQLLTGRLDAGGADNLLDWAACRAYAEKVARYQAGAIATSPEALLYSFATDSATRTAHQQLVLPLRDYLRVPENVGRALRPSRELFDAAATSANLVDQLATAQPALVFSASHGIEQATTRSRWGALTDATFVGAGGGQPLEASVVASADRFAEGAVFFAFACFSAGVPTTSIFALPASDGSRPPIEGAPFTAALPRALLAHRRGPVAFIGHVDRVTNGCFTDGVSGPGLAPFSDFVDWSLGGTGTLGQAMSTFRERAKDALCGLERHSSPVARRRKSATDAEITDLWLRYYDFSGFVLLGDPAIKLSVH